MSVGIENSPVINVVFRTAYYIPSIWGGSIAIAILWRAVFNMDGLINTILGVFGIKKINWMASPEGAMTVIVALRVWQLYVSEADYKKFIQDVVGELTSDQTDRRKNRR